LLSRLVRLRQTLAQMRDDLHGTGPGNMLAEANEQLILAALHAEEVAETAVSKLGELTRSSQHDPLTGLPNRVLMRDRLENAIALAQRHGTRLALLFVDLDDFKRINDTLGHAAGDEALKLVALRMRAVLRNSDTVSRHGGEEFLVLLPEISQVADAAIIARKLLAAISAPADCGGKRLKLSASIGIATYPEQGRDVSTLIERADAAMYRAKRSGPGRFGF